MTPEDAEEFLQAAARMRAQEKEEEGELDDSEDEESEEESEYETGSEDEVNNNYLIFFKKTFFALVQLHFFINRDL